MEMSTRRLELNVGEIKGIDVAVSIDGLMFGAVTISHLSYRLQVMPAVDDFFETSRSLTDFSYHRGPKVTCLSCLCAEFLSRPHSLVNA